MTCSYLSWFGVGLKKEAQTSSALQDRTSSLSQAVSWRVARSCDVTCRTHQCLSAWPGSDLRLKRGLHLIIADWQAMQQLVGVLLAVLPVSECRCNRWAAGGMPQAGRLSDIFFAWAFCCFQLLVSDCCLCVAGQTDNIICNWPQLAELLNQICHLTIMLIGFGHGALAMCYCSLCKTQAKKSKL